MEIERISTMLAVRNLAESAGYYERYFGFELVDEADGIVLIARGETYLHLVLESPPTSDKPGTTIAPLESADRTPVNIVFRVPDCRAAHNELTALGLEFLSPPTQPPWGGWRCFTRDPNGYLIEIEGA